MEEDVEIGACDDKAGGIVEGKQLLHGGDVERGENGDAVRVEADSKALLSSFGGSISFKYGNLYS